MTAPESPGAARTAEATRARQRKRALKQAHQLSSDMHLLTTAAIVAMIAGFEGEIRHRITPDRVRAAERVG